MTVLLAITLLLVAASGLVVLLTRSPLAQAFDSLTLGVSRA